MMVGCQRNKIHYFIDFYQSICQKTGNLSYFSNAFEVLVIIVITSLLSV